MDEAQRGQTPVPFESVIDKMKARCGARIAELEYENSVLMATVEVLQGQINELQSSGV